MTLPVKGERMSSPYVHSVNNKTPFVSSGERMSSPYVRSVNDKTPFVPSAMTSPVKGERMPSASVGRVNGSVINTPAITRTKKTGAFFPLITLLKKNIRDLVLKGMERALEEEEFFLQ
jgi:hypothetical protein